MAESCIIGILFFLKMAVVYVREQGACVHKSYLQMVIQKGSRELKRVPLSYVEQLVLFGNVQITTQLMQYLLEQGIEIHYFTFGGKYLGCSKGEHSKNIFLRCGQFEICNDMEKKVKIAKILIEGKIENQIAVIRHYRWNSALEYDWNADVVSLEHQLQLLGEKETIAEVMGIEGLASQIYFKSYGQMFKSELKFNGRNRRPPRDPVNSVLSLTYTFLTRDMCSILDSQSFETYLGFLHGIRYGRKSLALDMIEVFRQPVADRLVLRLFNKQILSKYDFQDEDMEGIYLNQDGFQKFCYEYEKWMSSKNESDSYRMLMRRQVQGLKNMIQYGTVFEAWKWKQGGGIEE